MYLFIRTMFLLFFMIRFEKPLMKETLVVIYDDNFTAY
jgi:hypothetical protein